MEMLKMIPMSVDDASLPSQGAWMEMSSLASRAAAVRVAPFTGSVDGNNSCGMFCLLEDVAPFTGSVD